MRSLPPLKALLAFEAAARHLSVQRAAEELHVTPSAISHQLKALEGHLGIRLFHRLNRRIVLTDTGRGYLQSIASVFDRVESATRHVIEGGVSDVLTVHCPPSFAPAWLLPRIGDFVRRHPGIELRVHATPEPPDFFRSDTDVEIRYGDGNWPGLTSVELMSDRVAPLVAPSLRPRLPARPAPADLLHLPLIHSERSHTTWSDWFRCMGVGTEARLRGLRFDRGYLSIQAAAQGLGIALESLVFGGRELQSGALVALFYDASETSTGMGHHLVYPGVYGGIPKVRAFEEWLLASTRVD